MLPLKIIIIVLIKEKAQIQIIPNRKLLLKNFTPEPKTKYRI